MKITKTKHKVNAVTPRLSDEDPDLLEQDDSAEGHHLLQEGWTPWSIDDMIDIKHLIENRMNKKQQQIMLAFLGGYNYSDIEVTEKYWRYHFAKGVKYIKKELGL